MPTSSYFIWTRLFQSREASSNSQAFPASSCLPEQTTVISQHLSTANLHTLSEIPHWDRASEHRAWPGGSFWRKCSEFCEEKKQSHSRAGLEELPAPSTTSPQLNQHPMAVAMEVSCLTSSQILETLITEDSYWFQYFYCRELLFNPSEIQE